METGDEFLNRFSFNQELESITRKDYIKISQFTEFEALSLDCNHAYIEGFQKSEILETLYGWIWGTPSQN